MCHRPSEFLRSAAGAGRRRLRNASDPPGGRAPRRADGPRVRPPGAPSAVERPGMPAPASPGAANGARVPAPASPGAANGARVPPGGSPRAPLRARAPPGGHPTPDVWRPDAGRRAPARQRYGLRGPVERAYERPPAPTPPRSGPSAMAPESRRPAIGGYRDGPGAPGPGDRRPSACPAEAAGSRRRVEAAGRGAGGRVSGPAGRRRAPAGRPPRAARRRADAGGPAPAGRQGAGGSRRRHFFWRGAPADAGAAILAPFEARAEAHPGARRRGRSGGIGEEVGRVVLAHAEEDDHRDADVIRDPPRRAGPAQRPTRRSNQR